MKKSSTNIESKEKYFCGKIRFGGKLTLILTFRAILKNTVVNTK